MNPKSNSSIINNRVILTRYYEYVDLENELLGKKIGMYQDELDISPDGFEVLYEEFNLYNATYNGWVKNAEHIFFVGNAYKKKSTYNQPAVKKTTIKKKFLADIEVIDKFFLKTKTEVFYTGKKIAGADAASFRKIEHTYFYEDDKAVYAYNITNGLSIIDLPKENRFFIPHCWYFADEKNIYHQSGWSNKIETVDPMKKMSSNHGYDLVRKIIWGAGAKKYEEETDPEALQKQRDFLETMQTSSEIFSYFFPDANARWNIHKPELYNAPLKAAWLAADADETGFYNLIIMINAGQTYNDAKLAEMEAAYNVLAVSIEKNKAIDKSGLDKEGKTAAYNDLYNNCYIPELSKLKSIINKIKQTKTATDMDANEAWNIRTITFEAQKNWEKEYDAKP